MWSQQVGVIEMILDFFNVHFPDAQIGTDYFKHCLSEVLTFYESTKSCQFDVKEAEACILKKAIKPPEEEMTSPAAPLDHQASCSEGGPEKEAAEPQQQQQQAAAVVAAAASNSDYFPCAFCGEIFPTHAAYEEHAARHHSRETGARASFECDVCGRSFERYLSFKRHRQHHALVKPFVCSLCARAFTRNHDLQRHRANVHRVRPAPPDPPAAPQRQRRAPREVGKAGRAAGIFFCDRCSLTFDSSVELRTHRATRCRGGPPLPPPNVSFPSESLLSLSIAADCLLGRGLKTEEGLVPLPPWKMETEEEEEGMEEEEDEEDDLEELACEHCAARFRLETDLVEHRILEHTPLGEPSPQGSPASSSDAAGDASCRLPSLPAFPTNPDVGAEGSPLAVAPTAAAAATSEGPEEEEEEEEAAGEAEGSHREESEGGDVWVCMYCSHRFCNKATMDRHMRTHTGEKPFQCPMCVRRFTRKHDLERHRSNIHHGVRPFACPHCAKTFPLKKNLSKHLLVSHRVGSPASVDSVDVAM